MLPSHNAFHSDTGLTLARQVTDPLRRKSIAQRRKSVAAITRGMKSFHIAFLPQKSSVEKLLGK